MRPFLVVLVPTLLVVVYAYAHPHLRDHFPDLPALPKVVLEHGSGSTTVYGGNGKNKVVHEPWTPAVPAPGLCVCGETEVGAALCDVYHQQGLRASRLVEGSGARTRRLLTRAREGGAIKIGVLGGSGESQTVSVGERNPPNLPESRR
jgi:hypothetical protein